MQCYGQYFKRLSVQLGYNSIFFNLSVAQLFLTLNCTTQLTELYINGEFRGETFGGQFNTLQTLTLHNDAINGFSTNLIFPQLTTLTLGCYKEMEFSDNFLNWLFGLNNLLHLHLKGPQAGISLFSNRLFNQRFRFQLKSLQIDHVEVSNNNLSRALRDVKDSLTKLTIGSRMTWSSIYDRNLEVELSNCTKLTSLDICCAKYFNYNRNMNMHQLKFLKLNNPEITDFMPLFSLCPNLEVLHLFSTVYEENLYNENSFIHTLGTLKNLRQLTVVHLTSMPTMTFNGFALQHLTKVKFVRCVLNDYAWLTLSKNCPLIADLRLDYYVLGDYSLKIICENMLNLHRMDLGRGYYIAGCWSQFSDSISLKNINVIDHVFNLIPDHIKAIKSVNIIDGFSCISNDYYNWSTFAQQMEILIRHLKLELAF